MNTYVRCLLRIIRKILVKSDVVGDEIFRPDFK